MKSIAIKRVFALTVLCMIVLLTLFAFGLGTVCAEETTAPAGDQTSAPSEDATVDTDTDEPVVDLHFDKDNVIAALNIMWKGVLAIFITIAIIIIVSVLMNKACNKAAESVAKRQKKIEEDLRKSDNDTQA